MVSLYFGLPGCGKTTFLTYLALKESKKLLSGRSIYKHIYCNIPLLINGVTCITNDCIGKYDLRDCLLLIDEATLFADSRDFKSFSRDKIEYFLEHRHFHSDIILFTQQWDGVDRKIRTITDRVYYVTKGRLLGHWLSKAYRVPYDIIIPDKRTHADSGGLGDIIQGYCKPSFITRVLLAQRIYRPSYYKYFDSFMTPYRPSLPEEFKVYLDEKGRKALKKLLRKKKKLSLSSIRSKSVSRIYRSP